MTALLQHLVNGLSLGAIYALIALGYTMVYGVLQLINFAHGDVVMVGAFAAYYLSRWTGTQFQPGLLNAAWILLSAMAICGALGFLVERLAYRPLRGSPRISLLITAIGVSLLLENGMQLLCGADPKPFPELLPHGGFSVAGVRIDSVQLATLLLSVALCVALQWIVFRTRFGRAMRAVSHDPEVAQLMGVPTDWIIAGTFVLGSSLAGAAGVLMGLAYPRVDPLLGLFPGLKAFVAAVLGGIGDVPGAMVGGLFLGLAEELVAGYGSSSLRDAIAFAVLIAVLVWRPTGLFGRAAPEKV